MRGLALVLAGCGRIAFDPGGSSTTDGNDSGGDPVPTCLEGMVSLPVMSGYALGRVPNGWAVAGLDSPRTRMELRIVTDDGDIGASQILTSVAPGTSVYTVAWLGDSLTILWSSSSVVNHGRFTLDGALIDSASLGAVSVSRGTGVGIRDELAFLIMNGTSVTVSRLDPAGNLEPSLPVTTNGSPASAAHGANGYLGLWVETGTILHLAGLDESGTPTTDSTLANASSSYGRVLRMGSSYLTVWDDADEVYLQIRDDSFATVVDRTQVQLDLLGKNSPNFASSGDEIGVVTVDSSPPSIRFQAADLTGAPTIAPRDFVTPGTATSITGVDIEPGPRRFAMLFGAGSPTAELYLAIACR